LANILSSFYHDIVNIIFPNNCAICNQLVAENQNCICTRCFSNFKPTGLENWIDNLRIAAGIDAVYSAWFATGSVKDIIYSIKYHNQPRLGEELGRRIAAEIPIDELDEIDTITAVPLNSTRKRERGYNQSEWICRGLSKAWGIPYQNNLIKRIKYTHTQTDLNAKERKENMTNAFSFRREVDSLSVVIVDDVITTGATLSACAVEIRRSGAKKVTGVSCCTPLL